MFKGIQQQFRQPKGLVGKFVSLVMRKMNNKIYDVIIDKMTIKDHETIFEIGYGHGIGIKKILDKNDCQISGIDFSETMHKEASKRNQKYIKEGKAALFYGDFLNQEMPAQSFDKIFCLNVVYFWDDLEIPFSRIKNGLKKDGNFHLYMDAPVQLVQQGLIHEGIFKMYTIDEIIDNLKKAGFTQVDFQHKNGYFVNCKK
jgi:cyclopropane fatty-acyl-phospholipid synthase-like methyltransferase